MPTTDENARKALTADLASTLYNLRGTGLKIGIISDSYNNKNGAAADVASGDLPSNVTVVRDLASGGEDEGRAMIELAYRIAPDATFFFASGYSDPGSTTSSIQSCANAVASLQAQGCNIIIDDLGFTTAEGFYQVGTVLDNAITTAVNAGINYFSAAGNDGKNYFEGGFTALTTTIAGIGAVVANDFGGSPYLTVTIPTSAANGKASTLLFEWAQPFKTINNGPGAANSLAIYLLNSAGTVVASSTTDQLGADPAQSISYLNTAADTAFRLVVVQNGGTVPAGQLFKMISPNAGLTITGAGANTGSGNIYGHELLTNQNSLAAVDYTKTPAFGVSPAVPASFTSVGTGTILFDAQGNRLNAAINANEPSFAAAQGNNTAVPGFAPFNGTSAAAPNAGAVAALALQANRNLTTAEVTSLMAQSAIPVSTTLPDAGAGLIQARAMVELAAAAAGARWTGASGGNWTTSASWSTGAAPTAAASALVGNNLGGFTGTYTLTANTAGLVAGSLAVGAASGSAATLSLDAGGSLSVGGSAANNATANDLLVSNNGTLRVDGGTLSVSRSLNTNNGTVSVTAGGVSAGDYWQNAGSFTVGGGGSDVTVQLTGGGLTQLGGSLTLSARGTLRTTAATVSASAFTVNAGATFVSAAALAFDSAVASVLAGGSVSAALLTLAATSAAATVTVGGTLTDTGALTATTAASRINVLNGGVFSVGAGTATAGITLNGTGRLVLASADGNVLVGGLTSVVSGLINGQSSIDFTGLAYAATDTTSYNAATGQLNLLDGAGNMRAATFLNTADGYTTFNLTPDSNSRVVLRATACFARGTLIATADGEAPVEALRVGSLVRTASGALRPVRWIGRRAYDGAFAAGNRRVLPVTIRAGALGEDAGGEPLPRRDLVVSPQHAMLLDGFLIPAVALVDGSGITQAEAVDRVEYLHVELETHDVLLAEGAPSESFVDDGHRAMFQNAAEFHALYPEHRAVPAVFCAPRLSDGERLEAIRARLAARGAPAPAAPGPLRGYLDALNHAELKGWAADLSTPDAPVRLLVRDNGLPLAAVLTGEARGDVAAAGLGGGHQGFRFRFDPPLEPWRDHDVTVERLSDGAPLGRAALPAAEAPPVLVPAAAADPDLSGSLDRSSRHRVHGWARNLADPCAPVSLLVFANGALLGRVVANRHRADLEAAGIGTGHHSFELLVTGGLSPLVDQVIEVRRASDGAPLPGSPLVIPAAAFGAGLRAAVAGAVDTVRDAPSTTGRTTNLAADLAAFLRAEAARLAAAPRPEAKEALPRVLVVNDRVPSLERDAGSRAVLSHVAALRRLGHAVSFVAAGELEAPGAADALAEAGAEWCGAPRFTSVEEVLRRDGGRFAAIYLHGEAMATRYGGLARAHCGHARILYAVADLHHVRLERQARAEECPLLAAEARGTAVREFTAAWAADAVLTHSAAEAAVLRAAVPQARVHVVPWAVRTAEAAPAPEGRSGVGFIGHFGHAPNRDAVRVLVEAVMPLVWAVDPTIPCVIAGSDAPPGLLPAGTDARVTLLGAVPDPAELFDRVRVMAAPLRFGAGIKGKVLDALAAGLPCALSPVAAEGLPLPATLAALVGAPEHLAARILALHADADAWHRAAAVGLDFVRRHCAEAAVDAALGAALGMEEARMIA